MVDKISGDKSRKSAASSISATRSVEGAKIGGIEQVSAADQKRSVGVIGRSTRRLSPAEHQQLLSLIEEEAERLFGDEALPDSKKETVKGAVKMAIEASMTEDSE